MSAAESESEPEYMVGDAVDELLRMAARVEAEGRYCDAIIKRPWPKQLEHMRAVYEGRALQCRSIARSLKNRAGRLRRGTAGK